MFYFEKLRYYRPAVMANTNELMLFNFRLLYFQAITSHSLHPSKQWMSVSVFFFWKQCSTRHAVLFIHQFHLLFCDVLVIWHSPCSKLFGPGSVTEKPVWLSVSRTRTKQHRSGGCIRITPYRICLWHWHSIWNEPCSDLESQQWCL